MRKSHQSSGAGIEPPADIVAAVRRLADEADTELAAARRLGIAIPTLVRLRAGLPVRAGTIALVRQALMGGAS